MYYVYVLKSTVTGGMHIGSSAAPEERLEAHNAGRVHSTKSQRPWTRLLLESHPDRQAAGRRERYLKSGWGRRRLQQKLVAFRCAGLAT